MAWIWNRNADGGAVVLLPPAHAAPGTRRGPLRRNPAADASARRLAGADAQWSTVSGQTAAHVLAGDHQLFDIRRQRLGRTFDSGPSGPANDCRRLAVG